MNICNNNGDTALMFAAGEGQSLRREILLQCRQYRSNPRIVQKLLLAGARVNTCNDQGHNALTALINSDGLPHLDTIFLLLAAGETFQKILEAPLPVLEKLMLVELKPLMKNLCREAIRTHLLKLNPHENLFLRFHKLKGILPHLLIRYLVYDMSVETNYSDQYQGWDQI